LRRESESPAHLVIDNLDRSLPIGHDHRSTRRELASPAVQGDSVQFAAPEPFSWDEPHSDGFFAADVGRVALIPAVILSVLALEPLSPMWRRTRRRRCDCR
jgi:hypothetical protein